ncbi:MAG: HAD-IIB family hydrolase [Desulfobacterales bacterium]
MPDEPLYVQMFSIHGLLRPENMELGRDADTGGQIRYVVELADSLSRQPGVAGVDLFTRLVVDKRFSDDYARPVEIVNDKFRIIRIQCGGRKYMRKELLWPFLDEYTDKTIKFIKREKAIPHLVHGHYPDAGYVAMQLASFFGIPFIYTGHSLGRSKKQKLLDEGTTEIDIVRKYKIDQRISTEEDILSRADLVVTSTHQEIEEQYGLYRHRAIPRYKVIPPGLNIEKFYPFYHDLLPETEKSEEGMYARASLLQELNRFFMHPDRPLILTLCRPDKRKNIAGLIEAYGRDLELQAMANLAVFAGLRKDIESMEENERDVLTNMLLLMDKFDLYGKMAIPKKHDFEYEVPELYRIAAEKRGVFVNAALTEPFGLTLLEASAAGLPIVATHDGGPKDILDNCRNGLLVDPTDTRAIAAAVKKIIADGGNWDTLSKNGIMNVRRHYTWTSHALSYLEAAGELVTSGAQTDLQAPVARDAIGRRLTRLNRFLITDIDNTLIGKDNPDLPELVALLRRHHDKIGFGIATGRTVESATANLEKHGVPAPDILITSVGSEIYYGNSLKYGSGWESHIADHWNRDRLVELLERFEFLELQEESTQRRFKISYNMAPQKDRLPKIHNLLLRHKCRYTLIYSHQKYLDVLPYRASKGKAIRYLSYKWEIPLGNFLTCGDSGNDEEMLRGEPLGVIVGNHSPELEPLKGAKKVYFAKQPCAGGILEGIRKYGFITTADG